MCASAWLCACVWVSESKCFPFSYCHCVFLSVHLNDYPHEYLPVVLRSIILWPYHHLDSFEGLPVVSRVVLCWHIVPCSPEDTVSDSLVPLVIVFPVEVSRHASVKPPARAVVGAAVSRGVHVIVAVRCGEKFLVMVEVLVQTESIPCSPTTMTHQYTNVKVLLYEYLIIHAYIYTEYNIIPVSTDRQPVE